MDIHLDAGVTADELDTHQVCDLTEIFGWGGRVAIGRCTKYSLLPTAELCALGRRLAYTGVAVTVLPATDLFVMGCHQDHGIMRAVADAHVLMDCGVNCSLSTDNVMNPFTPYGDYSLTRDDDGWQVEPDSLVDDDPMFELALRDPAALYIEDVLTADQALVNGPYEVENFGHQALATRRSTTTV